MISNNDRILLKSEYCGTTSGIHGKSYAHISRPVSVTSKRAVGESKLDTPRNGVEADEFFFVATWGITGDTPLSFDMNHPSM